MAVGVNELDYKRIKGRLFLLSLIPLQPARFSSTAGRRGNTFVAKIRPAFRPLSKDRMINHSRSVSLAGGTRAYVTADGNSSTSKIPIKARPVINLLGLCRSTALPLEHLARPLQMLLTTVIDREQTMVANITVFTYTKITGEKSQDFLILISHCENENNLLVPRCMSLTND